MQRGLFMKIINTNDMVLFLEGDTIIMKKIFDLKEEDMKFKLDDFVKDNEEANMEEILHEVKKFRKEKSGKLNRKSGSIRKTRVYSA
jgi:hypothetical protein